MFLLTYHHLDPVHVDFCGLKAKDTPYSTFSGVCVQVLTLFIVLLRIVAMILLSIPSIWSSRSMSSFVYLRSRDRSHSHQTRTMMTVMGIVMTKYIQTVGAIVKSPVQSGQNKVNRDGCGANLPLNLSPCRHPSPAW